MLFSVLRLFCLGLAISSAAGYSRAQTDRGSNVSDRDRSSNAVASTTSMDVLDDKRLLQIGDRLSMRVVEDRKPPVSLIVTDSGEVEVPLIGRVEAKGRSCKQLAYAIKAPLEREYYYKATVIVGLDFETLKSPGRVYVTGQVRNQGPLAIPPDETFTVSRAIIRAGGFADFANKRRVKLVRKNGDKTETIIVDLELVIKKGRTDKDPVVEPDDTIIVPERLINF
jgi:protein involved in polysaccharide export with SLBB domain